MPPLRTIGAAMWYNTERSQEENQERAYIAASRRSDRKLEARVESAKRASEVHKRRTGRSLRITEQAVINEEIYEEETDDFLTQYYCQIALQMSRNADFESLTACYRMDDIAFSTSDELDEHGYFNKDKIERSNFSYRWSNAASICEENHSLGPLLSIPQRFPPNTSASTYGHCCIQADQIRQHSYKNYDRPSSMIVAMQPVRSDALSNDSSCLNPLAIEDRQMSMPNPNAKVYSHLNYLQMQSYESTLHTNLGKLSSSAFGRSQTHQRGLPGCPKSDHNSQKQSRVAAPPFPIETPVHIPVDKFFGSSESGNMADHPATIAPLMELQQTWTPAFTTTKGGPIMVEHGPSMHEQLLYHYNPEAALNLKQSYAS